LPGKGIVAEAESRLMGLLADIGLRNWIHRMTNQHLPKIVQEYSQNEGKIQGTPKTLFPFVAVALRVHLLKLNNMS